MVCVVVFKVAFLGSFFLASRWRCSGASVSRSVGAASAQCSWLLCVCCEILMITLCWGWSGLDLPALWLHPRAWVPPCGVSLTSVAFGGPSFQVSLGCSRGSRCQWDWAKSFPCQRLRSSNQTLPVDLPSQNLAHKLQYRDTVASSPTHTDQNCQGCEGPKNLFQKWQNRDTAPTNTPIQTEKTIADAKVQR